MPRTWIMLLCLSGTILSGQSQNSARDIESHLETSSKRPELETAVIHPPGIDTGVTLLDTHVSGTTFPAEESEDEHLQVEAEEERKQQRIDFTKMEAGRQKRGAWGKRKHAPTVEANAYRIAGLGRPLDGWKKRSKGEMETSALMAVLKELHTEWRRLMDQGKAKKKEEEEEEDDDDDDEEDEDDDEGEGEGEGGEGEGEEEEEEEEEVTTQSPSNQTATYTNFTESPLSECQTTDREINCRGIGMTHPPIIHNLEATKLDMAENNIQSLTPDVFSGLPNLDTLDLSKNKLDDELFSQNPLSNLTSLKKLNLDGNQLTRIPMLPPSLEELKINNNKLSSLNPPCFKGLTNLLKLELEENSLHDGSVSPQTFRPLKSLLYLKLDNNRFRLLPQGLPPSLKVLKMNQNLIEEVTEEAVRGCVHLRVLDLSHNLLHEQAIADRAWIRLKALEALDLSYNRLTSVPMNLPRRLSNLTLEHNDISYIPAFAFRHLRPGLQSLRLSHNSLSNEGAERVSFVGTYRSLSELLLDNNRLGEVPLSVRQFKKLQVLRLDNNKIRLVRGWGVCHPSNSGSILASVHLENNLLEVERIPPNAFSCVVDAQGLVLDPQQGQNK
ncbi:extracellular matrix protein 2 [Thunnus albacares]|uniref:extracellular matrix protein 2 n=1 Tax=Thunnus albacares TaxID=8236 RepID=UPI001CF65508|nr:extracellular matrix protein 2 [Thunnus albacares]